jgi:hypothetical protein
LPERRAESSDFEHDIKEIGQFPNILFSLIGKGAGNFNQRWSRTESVAAASVLFVHIQQ